MERGSVRLSVPAEVGFARVVRMTAASLATMGELGVDDVEDVRMAAEEGFVYACATAPAACDVSFQLSGDEVRMAFSLGEQDAEDAPDTDVDLIEALLSAVCDDYAISDDGLTLSLVKRVRPHAE
jgi:serine/threonine-protein kinase RsbW